MRTNGDSNPGCSHRGPCGCRPRFVPGPTGPTGSVGTGPTGTSGLVQVGASVLAYAASLASGTTTGALTFFVGDPGTGDPATGSDRPLNLPIVNGGVLQNIATHVGGNALPANVFVSFQLVVNGAPVSGFGTVYTPTQSGTKITPTAPAVLVAGDRVDLQVTITREADGAATPFDLAATVGYVSAAVSGTTGPTGATGTAGPTGAMGLPGTAANTGATGAPGTLGTGTPLGVLKFSGLTITPTGAGTSTAFLADTGTDPGAVSDVRLGYPAAVPIALQNLFVRLNTAAPDFSVVVQLLVDATPVAGFAVTFPAGSHQGDVQSVSTAAVPVGQDHQFDFQIQATRTGTGSAVNVFVAGTAGVVAP